MYLWTVVLWKLLHLLVQQGLSLCDLHTHCWKGCETFSLSFCGYESKCISCSPLWKVSGWCTAASDSSSQLSACSSILHYCGFSDAYSAVLDGWTKYKLARQFPNLLFSVLYTLTNTHAHKLPHAHTCRLKSRFANLTSILIWSDLADTVLSLWLCLTF